MIAKYGVTRRRTLHPAVRPAAGLLAAGAVLAALAGCGSSSPQPAFTPAGGQHSSSGPGQGDQGSGRQTGSETAAQAIQAAAEQSKKINSYSIRMDESLTGATAEHITGNMQFRLKPTLLAQVDLSIPPASVNEILTTKVAYLKIPGMGSTGKPWVKLSLAGKNGTGAALGQLLQSAENSNPANQTAALTASRDLRKTGTELVNGVQTTRYEGSYSAADQLKKLPPALRKMTSQSIAALGITKVRFTIWIDGQHQMRRVITVEKGSGTTITTRLDIISINQPVNVTLPPPSQVTSAPGSLGTGI
ncbi:MAG TPA: hypothetical protein VF204_15710 [Streptosporangiaceae bacterium]